MVGRMIVAHAFLPFNPHLLLLLLLLLPCPAIFSYSSAENSESNARPALVEFSSFCSTSGSSNKRFPVLQLIASEPTYHCVSLRRLPHSRQECGADNGKMRQVEIVNPDPVVIHCNVNIVHPQLRDLLQPAGEKGKVLFINRLRIDCADFTTKKVPTALCTLDFTAVCLITGAGLVAAGGQQSELDIRPLLPLPNTSSTETDGESSSSSINNSSRHSNRDSSSPGPRHLPRWHLRTPTGGSINNSICIQPDLSHASSSNTSSGDVQLMGGTGLSGEDKDSCRHREKRRKEVIGELEEGQGTSFAWRRDDPSGRLEARSGHSSVSPSSSDYLSSDNIVQRNSIGMEASGEEKARQAEEKKRAQRGQVFRNGLVSPFTSRPPGALGSVRILVSNNDKSIKEFRLRPPIKWRSGGNSNATAAASAATTASLGGERIESGLPGLSRLQIVKFPTCINHSSYSPDGRHLVSVGDTPEVFLYSVDPVTGELTKITTYTASSDASFSTSWSPDGMRFAVASQDGYISVWDVRSSTKIASLQTSQIADLRGSGAARVVKWSPRGDLLAFSEHTNYIHIVETTTFTSSQRIKVPTGENSRGRNTSCNQEGSSSDNAETENLRDGENEYDVDDVLHSSTDTTVSQGLASAENSLVESTSPARFATTGRSSIAANTTSNLRPWSSARRYRDIGNSSGTGRSPLDRALLGEWSSSRRGGGGSYPEVYIDDSGSATRSQDPSNGPTSSTENMLVRRVDDIMATLESETSVQRGTGIWSLGSVSRRILRPENSINISGLTWDPDGDYLYVSTEDLIAQYSVNDLRRSFGQATMR